MTSLHITSLFVCTRSWMKTMKSIVDVVDQVSFNTYVHVHLYKVQFNYMCYIHIRPGKVDSLFIANARITPNTTASNFIMLILRTSIFD